jgi:hypothetical protein
MISMSFARPSGFTCLMNERSRSFPSPKWKMTVFLVGWRETLSRPMLYSVEDRYFQGALELFQRFEERICLFGGLHQLNDVGYAELLPLPLWLLLLHLMCYWYL